MSNTKWEKLFIAIRDSELSLRDETRKDISDNVIRYFDIKNDGLYIFNGKHYRYSTRDGANGGPVLYRDIEWIFIPSCNDICALKNLVDGIGVYEYDISDEGMKIYGYR